MKQELKDLVNKRLDNPPPPPPSQLRPASISVPLSATPATPPVDELIIEITGTHDTCTIEFRPFEISRLKGRYGNGPGFEKWVGERVKDLLNTFGGG